MKKIMLTILAAFMTASMLMAQTSAPKLPLRVYVEDLPQPFPTSAKVQMEGKINQMLTANGYASFNTYSDFFITVIANPVSKDVLPGAPTQIMQTLEFTFYICDLNRQMIFSTYTTSAKGVGETEAKSYLDAMKRVRINAPEVATFLNNGRKKIIEYYNTEAKNIFSKARSLALQHQYDEAFFQLCTFPTESSAYQESLSVGNEIYMSYINYQAVQNLQKAKAVWAAEQNSQGAYLAGEYLSLILPEADCYDEAEVLFKEIKGKVLADWEWEMKKYQDGVDLEKQYVEAWTEVGVAYGNNQQPVSTYIGWLR